MSENVEPLIFDTFHGIDKQRNPYSLPKEFTDDALNVYGHGDSVIKRPGVRPWAAGTAAGPIIDFCDFSASATTQPWLGMIVQTTAGAGGNPAIVTADGSGIDVVTGKVQYVLCPGGDAGGAITSAASTADRAGAWVEELVPCQGLVWRTCNSAQAERKLTGSGPTEAAVGAAPADECASAEWHKRHLWHFKDDNNFARFTISDVDAPETYPAANVEDADPRSGSHSLRGGISGGESMYVGSNRFSYMITGATAQSFRLTRLPFGFGLQGRRGAVNLGDKVIALAVRAVKGYLAGTSNTRDSYEHTDVVAMSGSSYASLGGPVMPYLMKTLDGNPAVRIDPRLDAGRMAHWQQMDLLMLAPQVRMPTFSSPHNRTMLVLSVRTEGSGGWWPWEGVGASQTFLLGEEITAIHSLGQRMIVGTSTGQVLHYDPLMAMDYHAYYATQSVPIPSYWGTHWIHRDDYGSSAGRKAFVVGGQTQGGNWLLEYQTMTNAGPSAFRPIASFNPQNYAGISAGAAGDVGLANFIRYRVTFPSDGIRSELRALCIGNKLARRTERSER